MATFGHGASHTKIIVSHPPYSFSPAVFKAEIKLSGDRTAVRFACGAESLAASAVYSFMVWAVRRRQDFHCRIYVRLRQFARVLVTLLSRECP